MTEVFLKKFGRMTNIFLKELWRITIERYLKFYGHNTLKKRFSLQSYLLKYKNKIMKQIFRSLEHQVCIVFFSHFQVSANIYGHQPYIILGSFSTFSKHIWTVQYRLPGKNVLIIFCLSLSLHKKFRWFLLFFTEKSYY